MERRITIEESVVYKEDYQMRMLGENEIDGLLSVRGRGMNGYSCYDFDVSGKISMKAMYARSEITLKDIKAFLQALREVLESVEEHLLNMHRILLKPEYIFYEEERFFFCYYPLKTTELWDDAHELMEYFVKRVDYTDKDCVKIVFMLHKETMEENYSLYKIIDECLEEQGKESVLKTTEQTEFFEEEERGYDRKDHDWIAEQEMGTVIMEEMDNMWIPVQRFLRKHKKPRWGEWDGLHIEEEEL